MADAKKCTKCGEVKPKEEYFKAKDNKDGLMGGCKECDLKRAKKRQEKVNRECVVEKQCSSCGVKKPRNEYHRSSLNKDGLKGECKSCRSKKEEIRYSCKYEYAEEKWCGKCGEVKHRNAFHNYTRSRDGLTRTCKECRAIAGKEYYNKNRKRYIAAARLRRICTEEAMPTWLTKKHHEQIQQIYDHARECSLLTGDEYVVDHVIPIKGRSVCGLHVPWNLQVLPSDVNDSKGNRIFNNWKRLY